MVPREDVPGSEWMLEVEGMLTVWWRSEIEGREGPEFDAGWCKAQAVPPPGSSDGRVRLYVIFEGREC